MAELTNGLDEKRDNASNLMDELATFADDILKTIELKINLK